MMNDRLDKAARLIARKNFYHFPGSTVVACCVELTNGHQLAAHSIGPRPEGFDLERGKTAALNICLKRIAGLEAYRDRAGRSEIAKS